MTNPLSVLDMAKLPVRLPARLTPPKPESFTSPVHDTWVVARVGRMLGIAVGICFVTGLISHNAQSPTGIALGPWPTWGYRVNQGLHVASGIACLPLLLAKVFAAYPRLFMRPVLPRPDRAGLPKILERLSIAVLVGAAFFEISTGLLNINQWYVFGFGFVPVHYALAWVMAGALLVHLAVKLPIIRRSLARDAKPAAAELPSAEQETAAPPEEVQAGRDRRGFVLGALGVTGVLTLLTVGQAVTPLSRLALLAPRKPGEAAIQGVPINKTADGAGLIKQLSKPGWGEQEWQLALVGPGGFARTLNLSDLAALEQVTVRLPITCVEGWSVNASWTGVRVRDLVRLAGGSDDHSVQVTSMERGSPYSTMLLQPAFAASPNTILATKINGQTLHLDHGYPARIMAPNRPGVLQTKWVERMEIRS